MKIIALTLIALTLSPLAVHAEARAPIKVSPYYHHKGPKIRIGEYSEPLQQATSLAELASVIEAMQRNIEGLKPEQMYVAAIRLHDLGDAEAAGYWYYRAQYLAQSLLKLADTDGDGHANGHIKKLRKPWLKLNTDAGKYINGRLQCDPVLWARAVKKAKNSIQAMPDLNALYPKANFRPKSDWTRQQEAMQRAMQSLINRINANKANWPLFREEQGFDDRHAAAE